ncbi:MAG: hypothetical protein GDA36_14085 [Rhodobacteraceae bacterium]|nr:hypothetical protein [Paracoccaceae bacterium]
MASAVPEYTRKLSEESRREREEKIADPVLAPRIGTPQPDGDPIWPKSAADGDQAYPAGKFRKLRSPINTTMTYTVSTTMKTVIRWATSSGSTRVRQINR